MARAGTGNSLLNQALANHSPTYKIHTVIIDDRLAVYYIANADFQDMCPPE